MTKEPEEEVEFAFCWYDKTQWSLLKELEPETLDDSYEDWRRNANKAFQELTAAGHRLKKVALNADDYLRWCKENDTEISGESRSAYAVWLLKQRVR